MQRMILAAALLLAIPVQAQPITVRDAFDRSVTLPAPPRRIVPIFASNVEIVASKLGDDAGITGAAVLARDKTR